MSMLTEHTQTDHCGFDRNSSHSLGTYVCDCGWFDNSEPERAQQVARKLNDAAEKEFNWKAALLAIIIALFPFLFVVGIIMFPLIVFSLLAATSFGILWLIAYHELT